MVAFNREISEFEDVANEYTWDLTDRGTLRKTIHNCMNHMDMNEEIKGSIGFNLFSNQVEIRAIRSWMFNPWLGKPITDTDILMLRQEIRRDSDIEYTTAQVHDCVEVHARKYSWHPIKDYLNSLKWDGENRLEYWLIDHFGTKNTSYVRAVSRNFLIGACLRIARPGCKFDTMLVLEGEQGIGKSRAIQVLGAPWVTESIIDAHSKDMVDLMQGSWIIESAELSVFKKQEINALKAFISKTEDKVRLAYGRRSEIFPRQCVFVGTVNPDGMGYLVDNTGNRRFWPVEVARVDFEALGAIRDQLWAEAWLEAQKDGVKVYIDDPEVLEEMKNEQNERRQVDPMEHEIEEYLFRKQFSDDGVWTKDIYQEVFGGLSGDIPLHQARRIAKIMHVLGWQKMRTMRNGERGRGWVKAGH